MKIVIDCDIPYIKGVLEPFATVEYLKGAAITASDVADADVLIVRTRTRCDEHLLGGSTVRLMATATIGYDHIDRAWCSEHDIKVVTAAGCNARGVLQWFGAVVSQMSLKDGWMPQNRTLGVVGVGNVGRLIVEYGRMWGFNVLCCDPPRADAEGLSAKDGFVDYNRIIADCDIITHHTLLTREGKYPTYHMFNGEAADRVRKDCLIMNSSRGEVVETDALNYAISKGSQAAIDTWEDEPDIDVWLLAHSCLATPHVAGYTVQGKATGTSMVVRAVAEEFGLPLTDWFPEGITPHCPKEITWQEMSDRMSQYFDIEHESCVLKSIPDKFESLRNKYRYREEFF